MTTRYLVLYQVPRKASSGATIWDPMTEGPYDDVQKALDRRAEVAKQYGQDRANIEVAG